MTARRVLREFLLFLLVAVPCGVAGLAFATFVLGESEPARIWYDAGGVIGYGLSLVLRKRHARRSDAQRLKEERSRAGALRGRHSARA